MFDKSLVTAILIFCLIISFPAFSDEPNGLPNYVPGELLVRFDSQQDGEYLRGQSKEALVSSICGGTIQSESEFVPGLTLVEIPEGLTVEEAIAQFENTPGVLYAQPNYIYRTALIPNDPCFPRLWGLNNDGNTGGTPDADIDAPEAWDIRTDANDIIVAVIDTGVDYTHPDLAANMWHNPVTYAIPERSEIPDNSQIF
jgi:subtilisin family serine protease